MTGMIPNPKPLVDQLGDSRQRPELGGIPVSARSSEQLFFELFPLSGGQASRSARSPACLERFPSSLLPEPVPIAGRGLAHAQLLDHIFLPQSLLEKAGGLHPEPFLFVTPGSKNSFSSHTPKTDPQAKRFIYLYESH